MHFRRIAVHNFRKLVSPVMIEGLGPGVTILTGDNEEGKSTLLEAIRTGLFERHNVGGKAVEAMQPYGSSVRPEIRLDFEIDGKAYSITKGFAHKPSALLTTPSGSFEGPAAEEQLAELLTFRVPKRGESKPDDQGVMGLFWLEQGHARYGLGLGETGRLTLHDSLKEEVGDVLGGSGGRRLLEAAKKERDAQLTSTGKPRAGAELSDAIGRAKEAVELLKELEEARRLYEEEIDELAGVRRELARIKTDRVLEKAKESLVSIEKEAKAIEGLRQEEEAARGQIELRRAELKIAGERRQLRLDLVKALERKEEDLKSAHAALTETERETGIIDRSLVASSTELKTAVEARHTAELRWSLSKARARLEELGKKIADSSGRLEKVERLTGQRIAAQKQLAGIKIDRRAVERIQDLGKLIGEERAALRAIATRVRFLASGSQVVRKGDEELQAGQPVEVTEATRFALEGFGEIDVEPGSSGLAECRRRLQEAESELVEELSAVDVEDLSRAKVQFDARKKAESEIHEATTLIAAHAPEGIDALRSAHAEQSAERDSLKEDYDPSLALDLTDPETEKITLDFAKIAEDQAQAALNSAEKEKGAHNTKLAVAAQRVDQAGRDLAATREELQTARETNTDMDLESDLRVVQAALDAAGQSKSEIEQKLAAANSEDVEQKRKRAHDIFDSAQAEQRTYRERSIEIESRLAARGTSGIGERLEEARGQEAQAIARRDRLLSDAQAWELLVTTLIDAERDAKEAFLEPVLKRIDPFLRLLLPDARVTLDEETLEITGVARDGWKEPYKTLSTGTREQLSVLVRLAFAVYLNEKGYPAAIILDDALVNSDDDRFERMQLALREAAESVQILILTCRPRDWRQFGAPIRRLADARSRAFEPA